MHIKRRYPERMPQVYTTFNDLSVRCHRTIIRYKGLAYYSEVSGDGDDPDLWFQRGDEDFTVKPNDPEIDISAIEVGYINTHDGVLFLKRNPTKQYTMGTPVSGHAIYAYNFDDKQHPTKSFLTNPLVLNQLDGNYPDFNGAPYDQALSSDIALRWVYGDTFRLYYRHEDVGNAVADQTFELYKSLPHKRVIRQDMVDLGFKEIKDDL